MEHICRYCGMLLSSWRKKYKHIHEKHKDELPQKGSSWNKGKTKETDEIVARIARIKSEKYRGENNSWFGKHHSAETLQKLKDSCGGYRIGSGRGKKGWYRGYYCDSSWELAFVMYNLDHHINFERNTKQFEYVYENKKRKYVPDWIMNGKYVEIKGYWTKQWQAKLEQFPKDEIIEVIDKNKIMPYLQYAINKYGENFIAHYDGYKPKTSVTRVRKKSPITIEELNRRKTLILNSHIDLTKYGSITKLSKEIGLSTRQIYYVIRNCTELKMLHRI